MERVIKLVLILLHQNQPIVLQQRLSVNVLMLVVQKLIMRRPVKLVQVGILWFQEVVIVHIRQHPNQIIAKPHYLVKLVQRPIITQHVKLVIPDIF